MDKMVWCDIETTGLDLETDHILEVGIMVTDLTGSEIASFSSVIGLGFDHTRRAQRIREIANMETNILNHNDAIVGRMHTESGLLDEVYRSVDTPYVVMERIQDFFDDNDLKPKTYPMCGSSIHFDRAMLAFQMPEVEQLFHYRNIDISTLKNLAMLRNPQIFEDWTLATESAVKAHRPLDDIRFSISEYNFYVGAGLLNVSI